MEGHLESCPACRQDLAKLRRLEDLLVAASPPPVPEGFADRVVAQARTQQAASVRLRPRSRFEPSTWKRIRISAAAAAALAAGLLLGLFMGYDTWRPGNGRQSVASSQRPDLLAAAGFEPLVEGGGDSLAQSYLSLTTAGER